MTHEHKMQWTHLEKLQSIHLKRHAFQSVLATTKMNEIKFIAEFILRCLNTIEENDEVRDKAFKCLWMCINSHFMKILHWFWTENILYTNSIPTRGFLSNHTRFSVQWSLLQMAFFPLNIFEKYVNGDYALETENSMKITSVCMEILIK